ncbi:MAG TPA: transcriptional regulator [Tepidisphaeraceae bacterium]|jgi:DNA-binding MarR family transcriptional regulator
MAGRKRTDSHAGAGHAGADEAHAAPQAGESGRFAYEKLERVIHEKARLSIMSSLAAHPEGLLFNDLKGLCSLTDGNLSRHLQLLQESKLVEVWKGFRNNRPQTLVRLTDDGRKRFLEYVQELEQVVADAMAAAGRAVPARLPLSKGFSPA